MAPGLGLSPRTHPRSEGRATRVRRPRRPGKQGATWRRPGGRNEQSIRSAGRSPGRARGGPGGVARERRPARHRRRAVHPGPGRPHARHAARLAGPGTARARARHRPADRRRLPGAGRGTGADRGRRARPQRRRREARRAAVPRRGHVLRPRGLLGARRDPGGGPAGRRQGRGRLRATARAGLRARRHQGRQLSGPSANGQPRRRRRRAGTGRLPVQRRARDRRPGALLPGDPGRAGAGRRERPDLRPVEHAAPVGDAGHRGARARPARAPGHRAVPANGRRLRRQGVPAARPGRHRRAGGNADRAPGQPAAEPQPGHPDDRQAAPVLRHLGGGLRRRQATLRAARHADQQRRLEPGPVRAGAGPGAVPHR